MKVNTRERKNARKGFEGIFGRNGLGDHIAEVLRKGKQGLDALLLELGRMLAETIMYIEREEISGPDYYPNSPEIKRWASQGGSIYIGDHKSAG